MALISVVIPTLGKSPWLSEVLKALDRERSLGVDLEVILVGPSMVLETVSDSVDRSVDTGTPTGFAEATNRGIEAARGDLIATLNDDAIPGDGWCRTLLDALDAHPDAAAVQGVNLRMDDPHLADGAGIAWTASWQAVQIGHGRAAPASSDTPGEIFAVSATAALYRAQALDDVGAFDQRLGSYYEDVDLGCRLRGRGWTAWTIPRARARHAGSLTGDRRPVTRWRLLYGNRWLVVARLLGRRFPRQAAKLLARDLRDFGAAAVGADPRRLLGLVLGLGRALRRLPSWMHRGEPLVALGELDRFRVSS